VNALASGATTSLASGPSGAWVESEFGAYAYVVAMPASDRNPWSNRPARKRLDSQQMGGVQRERPLV
jgi:hypothetical protein